MQLPCWVFTRPFCKHEPLPNPAPPAQATAPYVEGFDEALATLARLKTMRGSSAEKKRARAFNRLLAECHLDPRLRSLGLEAHLLLPVQRIPRYVLLLRELASRTPATHPDYSPLTQAIATIAEMADVINTRKSVAESRNRVRALEAVIDEYDGELVQPHRRLLLEADAVVSCGRYARESRRVAIFNDLVLIIKRRGRSLRQHRLFKFKMSFEVSAICVATADAGAGTVSVTDPASGRSLVVHDIEAEDARREWLAAFQGAISFLRDGEQDSAIVPQATRAISMVSPLAPRGPGLVTDADNAHNSPPTVLARGESFSSVVSATRTLGQDELDYWRDAAAMTDGETSACSSSSASTSWHHDGAGSGSESNSDGAGRAHASALKPRARDGGSGRADSSATLANKGGGLFGDSESGGDLFGTLSLPTARPPTTSAAALFGDSDDDEYDNLLPEEPAARRPAVLRLSRCGDSMSLFPSVFPSFVTSILSSALLLCLCPHRCFFCSFIGGWLLLACRLVGVEFQPLEITSCF